MTAPLAHVEEDVAAPADALWAVLSDFAHPQRLAASIAECTVQGQGVGAVRRVISSRGPVIYERLIECDPLTRRLVYEVLKHGDMPYPGITAYRARASLHPVSEATTRVSWLAEGTIEGPRDEVAVFLRTLYRDAIRNLTAEALNEEPCQ